MLFAIGFVGAVGLPDDAGAETIASRYDHGDVKVGKNQSSVSSYFSLDSVVAGIDTINAAVVSFYLRDDKAQVNETVKLTMGGSTYAGIGLQDNSDCVWKFYSGFIPYQEGSHYPGVLMQDVNFDKKQIDDFNKNGQIKLRSKLQIGVSSLKILYLKQI